MKFSSTKFKCLKPLILLLIVAHLYSCSSWQIMKKPYNKQIDEEKHKMLKVELVNGKKIELHNPYIQEDKLIGVIITENKKRFQIQKDTLSISFFDINQIKVKKIDTGKTIEGVFFYKCRDSNNIFSHVVFTYQSVVSRYNISAVN